MKKIISAACAAAMALTTFGMSAVPANAQSMFQSGSPSAQQSNRRGNENRRGFERRGNVGYYNNHRGSRERRPGYRQYNGFWFPPAAFIFGSILGGVLSQQNFNTGPVRLSQQHVNWCDNRYISYRSSDNTFQPYNGPRQQCVSPYYR